MVRHRFKKPEDENNDGVDLRRIFEELRDEDQEDEADTVKDGCPEDGAVGVAFGKPATRGNGQEEVNHGGHGADETDLKTTCADARGVDVEKVDNRAAQDAEAGNIVIKVAKRGMVFRGNRHLF